MVNERIQGLAEIYVQRMLISSLNQAPAILNSSIFNNNPKFIHTRAFHSLSRTYAKRRKKNLFDDDCTTENLETILPFPPLPYVYTTTRSISLVKTLTMRDNELKSISSSLSLSLTRLPHTTIPCHPPMWKRIFYVLFFWWMCVHNMKYVYRMRWKKKEEKKCWTQNMEDEKKKSLYTPRRSRQYGESVEFFP